MLHFEGVGGAFPVAVCVGDGKSMIRDRMFIREWLRIIQNNQRLAVAIESVTKNPKPETRDHVFSRKPRASLGLSKGI